MAQSTSDNDELNLRRELARLKLQRLDANARAEIAVSKLQARQSDRRSSDERPLQNGNVSSPRTIRSVLLGLARRAHIILTRVFRSGSSTENASASSDPAPKIPNRSGLERLRLEAKAAGPAMLFISHGRGGGTERHLREMQSALETAGIPVFILKSSPRRPGILQFAPHGLRDASDLPEFTVPHDVDALVCAIEALNVKHVHVQHLADAGEGAQDMVRAAANRAGIRYDVTVHDYMFVCPRITLIGASGLYCGEPESSVCNICLKISPARTGAVSIEDWREQARSFLSDARSVFVPSADVAIRMRSYFPQIAFAVRPHFTEIKQPQRAPAATRVKRRIATLGVLSPQKGAKLLLECAEYAASQEMPIEFVVIGYTSGAKKLSALSNVSVTGAYQDQDLHTLIREHRPDIVWFPSLLPETFSYTLSAALEAGAFPVTFDLGAPALRLKELGWGAIMPLDYMLSAPDIVQHLLTVPTTDPPSNLAQSAKISYPSVLNDYYGSDLEAIFQSLSQG